MSSATRQAAASANSLTASAGSRIPNNGAAARRESVTGLERTGRGGHTGRPPMQRGIMSALLRSREPAYVRTPLPRSLRVRSDVTRRAGTSRRSFAVHQWYRASGRSQGSSERFRHDGVVLLFAMSRVAIFGESCDALDVGSVREHVERLGLRQAIAVAGEVGGIACQRRWVARHVDDSPRRELGDAEHDAWMEPRAWRIDDD